jgi:hypothetical protein
MLIAPDRTLDRSVIRIHSLLEGRSRPLASDAGAVETTGRDLFAIRP